VRTVQRVVIVCVLMAFSLAMFASVASATAQWSRKYGLSCRTCHSAFPRLNYYGQQFMRNGYQDPYADEADGDELGKTELNERTFIDKIGNLLGVRLSFTPVQYTTNALANGDDRLALGSTDWVQFFVAGSIAENKSIFIEMAWEDEEFHYSWYKFGLHNLFDSSMANVIVGNLPARDYGAYPNRLRIMGPVKGDVFGIKSSGGASSGTNDEAPLNLSGSRPGIQYYGYQGPVLVWGGASPGDNGDEAHIGRDVNDKLHYWGGLRLEATEDMDLPIEGSAISAWFYKGTDTAGFEDARAYYKNAYDRFSVEAEVRTGDFELMAAYVRGTDDNWYLDGTDVEVEFNGMSIVGGYAHELENGPMLYYALQYDDITSDDAPGLEKTYLTPSISIFPRENIRVGLYGRIDMCDVDEDEKSHDIILNVRTMF